MSQCETRSPESLVRDVIARWREGERPDAQQFLRDHPQVCQRKSLAVDLIYEEYCLRQEHGETFVASTFMNRFPAYKQSLARMLDVHQFLDGAAGQPASWPQVGDRFLGFEVVEQIGAGAVAKVYLAREAGVGHRPVVIKVSQFGRGEAQLMGKLAHPGVVPIHSVHEDPLSGMTCICMPFLGTATLVDLLDQAFALGSAPTSAQIVETTSLDYLPAGIDRSSWRAPDPFFRTATYEEGVVHLGRQIVAALDRAHQAGITHRDIKPSNVLLSREARPMLLDFNLSTDERLPVERVGGTLAYMAPERIEDLIAHEGEVDATTDPRADLYSVGAMLFELLTGQLPSRPGELGDGRQASAAEWLTCRRAAPPSARGINPHVEPALDGILQRCLAPDPSARYASAKELQEALDRQLHPRVRLGRKIRARRQLLMAAGLGAAAAALGGVAFWLSLPPKAVRLYDAGLAAYDRGDYKAAKRYFTESIDAGNDSLEVYFARGQTHRQLGEMSAQLEDFSIVQERDKSGAAAIFVGNAASGVGMGSLAIAMYQEAQLNGWDLLSVANSKAIAFVQNGNFVNGIEEFNRVLSTFPENDDLRFNCTLSWLQYANSTLEDVLDSNAIVVARRLASQRPNDPEVLRLVSALLNHREVAVKQSDQGTIPLSLDLRWRRTSPPTSPRLADCIQALQAEPRIK